eukprot:15414945-Alexandrium_andersonii.AAC.2
MLKSRLVPVSKARYRGTTLVSISDRGLEATLLLDILAKSAAETIVCSGRSMLKCPGCVYCVWLLKGSSLRVQSL